MFKKNRWSLQANVSQNEASDLKVKIIILLYAALFEKFVSTPKQKGSNINGEFKQYVLQRRSVKSIVEYIFKLVCLWESCRGSEIYYI